MQSTPENFQSIAKAEISILNRPLDFHPLALDFFEVPKTELGDGELVGLERPANQLAPNPDS